MLWASTVGLLHPSALRGSHLQDSRASPSAMPLRRAPALTPRACGVASQQQQQQQQQQRRRRRPQRQQRRRQQALPRCPYRQEGAAGSGARAGARLAARGEASEGSNRFTSPIYGEPIECLVAKERLLRLVAPTERGRLVQSAAERRALDAAVRALERSGAASGASTGPVAGSWRLAYSSVPEVWRASPFYWALEDGLRGAVNSPAAAPAAAAAIDALRVPLQAEFGEAEQEIDLSGAYSGDARLVSRVSLSLLRGLGPLAPRLAFVTECRLQMVQTAAASAALPMLGAEMDVTLLGTHLESGTPLDQVEVPLEQLLAGFVTMKNTFCDMDLRISRIEGKIARQLPSGGGDDKTEDTSIYHVWARVGDGA